MLCFVFFILFFVCLLSFRGRLQRQRADIKGQGDEWDWGARCETHKESVKFMEKNNSCPDTKYSAKPVMLTYSISRPFRTWLIPLPPVYWTRLLTSLVSCCDPTNIACSKYQIKGGIPELWVLTKDGRKFNLHTFWCRIRPWGHNHGQNTHVPNPAHICNGARHS